MPWNPQRNEDPDRKIIGVLTGVIIAVFLISLFFMCTFFVDPGEQAMIYSWNGGLQPQVYTEGGHIKLPIVNSVIFMNTRVQKQEEQAAAPTKDLLEVTSTVAVNFKIDPSKTQEIYRTIGQATSGEDYMQQSIMNPIIQESVRQATAKYTAGELVLNRTALKSDVDERIKERLAQYNIVVLDVSMTNFKFPDEYQQAINAKQAAQQNALKEQQNIAVAEAVAQQKIKSAQGDAQAIKIVNEELSKSPDYTKFLIVNKWNGVMPLALGSGSLVSIADTKVSTPTTTT